MKEKILFIIATLLLFSCNSKEEKKNKINYPSNSSLAQTNPELKISMERGKMIYNDMCMSCHLANGKGVPKTFPPLAESNYLKNNQKESIIGLKKGVSGEITVNGNIYNNVMAPLGLSDDEIADIMNYINNSWGNKYGELITTEEVTKILNK